MGGREFDYRVRINTQGVKLRNECTPFARALHAARPSRLSDDHVKIAVSSPVGDVKIASPISKFVLNTLTLK